MKVIALLGSPRKGQNTSILLNTYLEGVKETYKNSEVEVIDITRKNIKGCTGCNACQMGVVTHCSIKDDMDEIYTKLLDADVVIFASPIYYFSVTAQMKLVLDRLYALISKQKSKKIVFLSTYGDATKEGSGYNMASRMFEMSAAITGQTYIHNFGANSYPIPIKDKPEILQEVYTLGTTL